MRVVVCGLLLLAATLALAAGAGVHAAPQGRLTYVAWIERGGGTGLLSSPSTLCEVNPDGSGARRVAPRLGIFAEPTWTRDGSKVAFAVGAGIDVSEASPWIPTTIVRNGRWPAWSPDATRIAYVGPAGLSVAAADGSNAIALAGGESAAPSWSADGARIVFARSGVAPGAGLFLVPSAGGPATRLNADGKLPAWSPDGARIAFVASSAPPATAPLLARDELYVSNPDGGGRLALSSFTTEETSGPIDVFVGRPAWSPDSSAIAVVRTVVFNGVKGPYVVKRSLFVFDAAGGGRTDVSPPGAFASPAWRPAPALAPGDATRRPCEIFASGGTIRGTAYDDLIRGSDRTETIRAGAGNDWVHAERGADTVEGGAGRDELWSGAGRDVVLARDGTRDVVHCGDEGRDTVHADKVDLLAGRCLRARQRAPDTTR